MESDRAPASAPGAGRAEAGRARPWAVLLALLLVAALAARLVPIVRTLPYPQHVDERGVTQRALSMLRTGNLNPAAVPADLQVYLNFKYGTFPTYLATGAAAVGYAYARATGALASRAAIRARAVPYYQTPLILAMRAAFALVSVGVLLLTGLLAARAFGAPCLLVLAPLVLELSGMFFALSWRYVNVDVVGTLLVAVVYCALARATTREVRRPGLLAAGVGALVGLVVATKISMGLIVLPGLVYLVAYERGRFWRLAGAGAVGTVVAYLAADPFVFVNLPGIVRELQKIRELAGTDTPRLGQSPFFAPAGLGQLWFYTRSYAGEYGWALTALVGVGAIETVRRDWRRATVLLSFPVAHLLFLATQSVRVLRYIAPVYPMLAALGALGLLVLWRAADGRLAGWGALGTRLRGRRALAAGVAAALVLPGVPWTSVRAKHAPGADPRNAAVHWLAMHAPPGSVVAVPAELQMRTASLDRRFTVVEFKLLALDPAGADAFRRGLAGAYVVLPSDVARYPWSEPTPTITARVETTAAVVRRLAGDEAFAYPGRTLWVGTERAHNLFSGGPALVVAGL